MDNINLYKLKKKCYTYFMKKILLTLGLFLLTSVMALAFTMPRWSYFPVKVYVPDNAQAPIINAALNDWSNKSSGIISFKPSKSKISANIVFDVVDSANQIGSTNIHAATTYLFKVDVTLAKSVNGKNVTSEQLKASALHEIANALGLKLIDEEGLITSKSFYEDEQFPTDITPKDIAVLEKTYKETSISENMTRKNKNKD